LVGSGVACPQEDSGTGRPSDSRYVLIIDLVEEVKETACDRGPDVGETYQTMPIK